MIRWGGTAAKTAAGRTTTSSLPRLRICGVNDVYSLENLPRLQTFLRQLQPAADVICLAGDFLSPSPLAALDGGKGMVATLRALGMTHVSLGNHEADLKLTKLRRRLTELQQAAPAVVHSASDTPPPNSATHALVASSKAVPVVLNSNLGYDTTATDPEAPWMTTELSRYSIVSTPCGTVKVGLLGLLSDETGMFRDGTFRGVSIGNVMDTFRQLHHQLVQQEQVADWILPLTHASITRDEDLGRFMPTVQPGPNIILGGHEHVPYDVTVHPDVAASSPQEDNDDDDNYTRILKAGTDAMGVSLVDIYFDVPPQHSDDEVDDATQQAVKVKDIEYELVDIRALTPSMVVQNIVDQHESILKAMENEDVLHADPLLPPGELLSSEGTRLRQTTLGGILCTCIKEELETDVAILNGAVIKGNTTYDKPALTYSQMKQELPFPTKIVIVTMKRWELQEAIEYSRTSPVEGVEDKPQLKDSADDASVERRGYLQVDLQYNHSSFHVGDHDDELTVALPRNLLNGFCKIKPLMEVGQRLKQEGIFPEADEFIPAIDLVIRHSSKERWYELIHDNYTFADLDPDAKGYLSRADVERILTAAIHHRPPDFLIDDMMGAIDFDDNGIIDPGELSHLLAVMEREHGVFRFED